MTKFLKKFDFSLSRYKVKNGIYFLYLYVIFGLAGFELVLGVAFGWVKTCLRKNPERLAGVEACSTCAWRVGVQSPCLWLLPCLLRAFASNLGIQRIG
jgi:hypothetical protein